MPELMEKLYFLLKHLAPELLEFGIFFDGRHLGFRSHDDTETLN